jgi:hypothetical protein
MSDNAMLFPLLKIFNRHDAMTPRKPNSKLKPKTPSHLFLFFLAPWRLGGYIF